MKKFKLNNIDYFALLNCILFFFMCFTVYFSRFIKYIGSSRIAEFYFYACLICFAIILLWWHFRKITFPKWVLAFLQLGIIMHFSGGFININGHRLYDCFIIGIRYDKYVHFVNAFAIGMLIEYIFLLLKADLKYLRETVVFFMVLGLGALVEIFEYVVTKNIKHNGVGGYDNNMQDLISNAVGALCCILIWKLLFNNTKNEK